MKRTAIALSLALACSGATALTSAEIVASVVSYDCIAWRVAGICFWLFCTQYECEVRTSTKYRHYFPDAVVSAYAVTGENPWEEVRSMSGATSDAQGGEWYSTNQTHENNLARFKEADVIGHPGTEVIKEVLAGYEYFCDGAGIMFVPYFLSVKDASSWREDEPEANYPGAWIPGWREISDGSNTWGNLFPRVGFFHQSDDYKMGAVIAQRAGNIVTQWLQPHIYWPLLAMEQDGYWPAGELIEGDIKTGKWQELYPTMSATCAVFPHSDEQKQSDLGDYAWTLWRPYACCEREGQAFLFDIDWDEGGQP
jgi:integrating conjugative element protein (TIGR03756 family)